MDEEDQQNRQLILHLIKTKGKGQLVEEIKALNKQQIKAPTTYLDMMQQIAYFGGLCQMFFGQYSYATQAIRSLTSYIEKCKQSFKAREQTEKEFCSKFLYAIDTRYQLWLEECMIAPSENRVDDSILDFRSIIEHKSALAHSNSNFHQCSPPPLSMRLRQPQPPKLTRERWKWMIRIKRRTAKESQINSHLRPSNSAKGKHGEVLLPTRMSKDAPPGKESARCTHVVSLTGTALITASTQKAA